jgi:hypothetical protein
MPLEVWGMKHPNELYVYGFTDRLYRIPRTEPQLQNVRTLKISTGCRGMRNSPTIANP